MTGFKYTYQMLSAKGMNLENPAMKNVFISMGTPRTPEQIAFRDEIIAFVEDNEMIARMFNRGKDRSVNSDLALPKIKEVMDECDGVIVVAHERIYLENGFENRLSEKDRKQLDNVIYPTPWNHIEASLGYALSIPMFVLIEDSVRSDGLNEFGFHAAIERVKIARFALREGDARERLKIWCEDIKNEKLRRTDNFSYKPKRLSAKDLFTGNLTLGDLLVNIHPRTAWQIAVIAGVIFGAGAGLTEIFRK